MQQPRLVPELISTLPSWMVWEMEQLGTDRFQPGKALLTHVAAAGATASPGHHHLSPLVATPVAHTRWDKHSACTEQDSLHRSLGTDVSLGAVISHAGHRLHLPNRYVSATCQSP